MKEPKKIRKAVKTLNTLIDYLHFFMGDTPEFKRLVKNEFSELEEILIELGMDQKQHNIRLAKKLKDKWDRQKQEQEIKK